MLPNYFCNSPQVDERIYYSPTGPGSGLGVQIWDKPNNKSMVCLTTIGGGGAGGNNVGSSSVSGSGGGGTGAISRLVIPLIFLPSRLYIIVGRGGRGSSGALATTIGVQPITTASSLVLRGNAGSNGSTVVTGGGGGAADTQITCPWSSLGIFTSIVGQTGGAGGNSSPGASITALSSLPISAGAGGGGATSNGGDILGAGLFDWNGATLIPGGVGVASGTGNPGQAGVGFISHPKYGFMSVGGSGGGGTSGGTAGNGGRAGGYGSGGGGGGASSTSGSGGAAGDGGDGLAIITCW